MVADIKTALQRAGLRDGMTIGTHHHFRNGDLVANRSSRPPPSWA